MNHDPLFDPLESAGSAKSARSARSAVVADPRSPLKASDGSCAQLSIRRVVLAQS